MTVHGFRACFKLWARDETSFGRDLIEACLSHAIADPIEAAYRRSTFLAKPAAPPAAKVVELHEAKAAT